MSALKLTPLGGLGEIGMNCLLMEYEDEAIVVDCGLLFSELEHFGVDFVIPDFSLLKEKEGKIKAFVLTHGHEDHIGALPFAIKYGIRVPIYGSQFTLRLVEEKLKEHGLLDEVELRPFKLEDHFSLGKFKISTTPVNHSIIESCALFIDTPIGTVVHTGDFKIDPTPFYGSELRLDTFKKAGEKGVLLLLSDSTNVERHECSMSEKSVYHAFENLFAAAQGLTVVSMFASNVGRIGQILEIADRQKKKVCVTGRSMQQNLRIAEEEGYLKHAKQVLIPLDEIDGYDRDRVIVVATGSQGEYRAALARMAYGEHRDIQLEKGDKVILSSKFIPGNEKAIGRLINELFKQGAEVLYESIHQVHVSGHAARPELETMLKAVRPQFFIPIHGEYRHLVHHAKLAIETGVPEENTLIVTNGDVVEVTSESIDKVDHIEETRVLIEGAGGQDISKLVLSERRKLGEKGVVFSLLVRNADSRGIIAGPEIIFKGLVAPEAEAQLIGEAREIVKKVVEDYQKSAKMSESRADLQETIRIELRRFFNQNLGKKPTVLPIVLDL